MRIAIIYCSKTGNTAELVELVGKTLDKRKMDYTILNVEKLPMNFSLLEFDAVLVGTYTWGKGDIPGEMKNLFKEFEIQNCKHITTGVFGTGDRFYPNFCGAVDKFRDMLYVQTDLAVTLKVELSPQQSDEMKCEKFVEKIVEKHQKSRVA